MDNDYSVHNFVEALFIAGYRFFRLLYLIRLVVPVVIWFVGIGLLIVQWIDTIVDICGTFVEKNDVPYAEILFSPLFCESCWFLLLISTSLSLTMLLVLPTNIREMVAATLAVIVGASSVHDFFQFLDANDNTTHRSYLPLLQQWELILVHLHTQAFFNAFLHWSGRSQMTLFTISISTIPSIYQSTANIALLFSLVLRFSTRPYLSGISQQGWGYILLGGLLLIISLWALRQEVSYWWTLVVGVLWGLYIKHSNKLTTTTSSSSFSAGIFMYYSVGVFADSVLNDVCMDPSIPHRHPVFPSSFRSNFLLLFIQSKL